MAVIITSAWDCSHGNWDCSQFIKYISYYTNFAEMIFLEYPLGLSTFQYFCHVLTFIFVLFLSLNQFCIFSVAVTCCWYFLSCYAGRSDLCFITVCWLLLMVRVQVPVGWLELPPQYLRTPCISQGGTSIGIGLSSQFSGVCM